MGITKSDFFSNQQNNIAKLFKALGHPARIAIVEHLLQVNTCIGGEIVDELPLSQSTISQHLKELKSAGIIQGTIEGNAMCYCIDARVWEELGVYLRGVITKNKKNNNTCC